MIIIKLYYAELLYIISSKAKRKNAVGGDAGSSKESMNGTAFTEPAGTDFCSVRAGGEQSYEVTLFKIQILTMLYCSAYNDQTLGRK